MRYNPPSLDNQYEKFLNEVGCSSDAGLGCLQKKSSYELMRANRKMVEASPWGQFTFGPAIDASYVRDLPGRELLNGNYVRDIEILVGHTKYTLVMLLMKKRGCHFRRPGTLYRE
jgi:carboxylesterase type B